MVRERAVSRGGRGDGAGLNSWPNPSCGDPKRVACRWYTFSSGENRIAAWKEPLAAFGSRGQDCV